MAGIDLYLKSELSRLERRRSMLEQECEARPKGSLVHKMRGMGNYAYIVFRENGKVLTKYVGKASGWKAQAASAKLSERRYYENELAGVRTELDRIRRMLKAGGSLFD